AGATFTETFHDLHDGHGLTSAHAFRVTMRVYRSGGLTKDAIYLRGLDRLLRYLADGQPLDPLLVGKVPLDYVTIVQELRWRGVLRPPRLQPRWLDPRAAPGSEERLAAVRAGFGLLDLIPGDGT
ncbi:MAG TPA: tyrosine/phenylalanine carboxypeptidase domain-containing protein, partial [Acidimicrobiia bacterium]|nr:tyrosine/phenylalanine carboxypeptidase domain-containing protein [Acidimicrobiia bacterium]